MGEKEVKKREARVVRKQCMKRYTRLEAFVQELSNTL
jgi:hypothetical protein